MNEQVLSVKQVNNYIKSALERHPTLSDLWIKGEISNYTLHRSGHMYFSVKEEGSVLKSVMFAGSTRGLRFIPKEGTKVIIRGNITVYEPNGQYQLVVREMQQDGIGNLHLAYEELKEKLQKEGLFHAINKKEIPQYPKTIGIITSPTGAALHDMISTIKRRYPIARILLAPVVVQGDSAPRSIIEAIELMNSYKEVDVLIVGRGGGSIEDLWGFNHEGVARAIYASNIPIISAVGHETDFTIADFVADMRAPTPTGAAEFATPYTVAEMRLQFAQYENNIKRELLNKLTSKQDRWKRTHQTMQFFHPKKVHETNVQKHDLLHEKLLKSMDRFMQQKERQYNLALVKLDGLSPLKIMSRGYSAVFKEKEIIKQINQVQKNDTLTIQVADGSIYCTVDGTKKPKEGE